MSRSSHPAAHLPLSVPVFHILLSLADRDLHGYGIIQDVTQRSGGDLRLTASTLYTALKRLLEAGMIEEVDEPARALEREDERRRYYRMTGYGREIAKLEAARLERAASMARAKRLLPRARKT
jgi:DNA-binding PadR family transcriptional regulator